MLLHLQKEKLRDECYAKNTRLTDRIIVFCRLAHSGSEDPQTLQLRLPGSEAPYGLRVLSKEPGAPSTFHDSLAEPAAPRAFSFVICGG